jgi:hypothetical protein
MNKNFFSYLKHSLPFLLIPIQMKYFYNKNKKIQCNTNTDLEYLEKIEKK